MIITDRFTLKGRSLTVRVTEFPHTWHFIVFTSVVTWWLLAAPFSSALKGGSPWAWRPREKRKEDQEVYGSCFTNLG
jgi:hypothetical protein